jgi:midasin (ATPase involved in ribosome maturation)
MVREQAAGQWNPAEYLDVMYLQRMRSLDDRAAVLALFQAVFTNEYVAPRPNKAQ